MKRRTKADEVSMEEGQYRGIFEAAKDTFLIFDLDGVIREVNPAACEMYGYAYEEMIGLTGADIVHPDYQHLFKEFVRKASEGELFSAESVDSRKDGSPFDVEVRGSGLTYNGEPHLLAVVRDVTERKQAEERIEHLNLVLRAIRNVNQLITQEKDRGKLIQGACENLIENRGYYGAWIALLDESGELEAAAQAGLGDEFWAMRDILEKGERVHCAQRCLRQDGVLVVEHPPQTCGDCPLISEYQTRSGMSARLDHEGRVYGLISVSIPARLAPDREEQSLFGEVAGDIAFALHTLEGEEERQRAQDEVRRLNRNLERLVAERTAELEAANQELQAFAYSVSHDLRAPLRGMDGFSQALLEDYGDKLNARGKDYARRVRAASQRMGRLIDDILQLSRVTRHEMKRGAVDLSGLARAAADKLRRRDPARQVTFAIQEGVAAEGDAHLLSLALENLLSNAWKFTQEEPEARIAFGAVENAACDAPQADLDDDATVYYVQDNGAGFEMAYADKLFEPFQRLHSEAEFSGTGIGLATVQRIVRRHGGRVWAEGAAGKGATFYFTLRP
jgi:PAS domain S-box-containing protein